MRFFQALPWLTLQCEGNGKVGGKAEMEEASEVLTDVNSINSYGDIYDRRCF